MLSPNFQVADFQIEEYNQEPVNITYRFKNTDKVVTKEIFKTGSNFPSTKSVTFENKQGNCELLIGYGEQAQVLEGLPKQIAQYDIAEGEMKEGTEKCSFTMRVTNNIHNIPQLDQVEFVQEWTEEEKIPIKVQPSPPPKQEEKKPEENKEGAEAAPEEKKEEAKPAEPEIQYEIKKRNKKSFSNIKFSTQNFGLHPNVKKDYFDFEMKLTNKDRDILEMKSLRNSLEAYSYEMRNNLDSYGTWEKYLDEETRKTFIAEINQVVEWIYGEGEAAPKEEYRTRLDKFKQIGEPVKQRHFYYSELDIYFSQFETATKAIQEKMAAIAHLTDAQKELVLKKQEEVAKFMQDVKADREAKQLYQDPAFNLDAIINKLNLLKSETEAIFNAPPPKEEKPDESMKDESKEGEAKGEEAKDAEMKNEEAPKEEAK